MYSRDARGKCPLTFGKVCRQGPDRVGAKVLRLWVVSLPGDVRKAALAWRTFRTAREGRGREHGALWELQIV